MKTNQANALYSAVANGNIIPGASRFVGTLPALKPTEMYIKLDQEDFDPANLPGKSFYPLNGGFVVDFGEEFLEDPQLNDTTFQGIAPVHIIELTIPAATTSIQSGTFNDLLTTPEHPLLLIIPEKVSYIASGASYGIYISTLYIAAPNITIASEAFAGSIIKNIIFAKKEGRIVLVEGAFAGIQNYEEELIEINLPEAPIQGKLSIVLGSGCLSGIQGNINIPKEYGRNNPNTEFSENECFDSYNVNYNGTDPNAPWGALRLNGVEV